MTPETLTPYAAVVIGLRHLGYIDVKSQGSLGRLTTLQTSQKRCGDVTFSAAGSFGQTRILLQLALFSQLADLVELSLQRELVEQVEAQARENLEPRIELDERGVERAGLCLVRALDGRRILDPPMCRDRLAWPHRADFLRGGIAHGEHEIERRRIPCRELVRLHQLGRRGQHGLAVHARQKQQTLDKSGTAGL